VTTGCLDRPVTSGRPLTAARSLIGCGLLSDASLFLEFLDFFLTFFFAIMKKFGWAWHFGKMGVQHFHFLNLAPTLGKMKSLIPHGAWRFFFSIVFLLNLEYT
jgi:hypothetical protein